VAGIGLLLNPRAKRTAKDPELAGRLARVLGDEGMLRRVSSREELVEAVSDFRRAAIDMVAIAGGDGTNHVTLSGLVEVYGEGQLPAFAMLRGGTMNTVANSFGVPRRRPEALLASVMRSYARRAIRPMRFVEPNVMRVGEHFGFIFGTGAIYGFIAEYNSVDERSPLWAAKVLARGAASAFVNGEAVKRIVQRWHGSVRFDDGSAFPEREYLTVGASTCGQIGLGFKPFYRSGELPDHVHMLGIHTNPVGLVRGLPSVWRGHSLGGERTYEKLTRRATLESSSGVVPYTLDGDVYQHDGALEVSAGPRVRVVVPD
jgi:diacylglycerol kinase family enzyme